MKHGISPTTPRGQTHERMAYLSKPLAQQVTKVVDGKVQYEYLPLHVKPESPTTVRIVVAPVKGKTYRRTEPKAKRPGRIRRTVLAELRAIEGA